MVALLSGFDYLCEIYFRNSMKLSRIFIFAAVLAALAAGCKKPGSTTREFLDGDLTLSVPAYVAPGSVMEFDVESLMTASRGDGGPLGYYFNNPFTEKSDTVVDPQGNILVPVYTVTVSDTLGPVTLLFGAASSDKYYGTTAEAEMTVVKSGFDGNGSITGFVNHDDDLLYTDTREDTPVDYSYVRCGDTYWMRTNLAWGGAGVAYEDCDVMDGVFGRYYSWEEAQTACPPGWRLPSEEDWLELAREYGSGGEPEPGSDFKGLAGALMADLYFNGTRMWEYWPEVKVTDASRLSVMPAGYAVMSVDGYNFGNVYSYAAFWTSEDAGDKGVLRYIYEEKDIVYRFEADKKGLAASVRCVRDAE